jgi:hypothetical protein
LRRFAGLREPAAETLPLSLSKGKGPIEELEALDGFVEHYTPFGVPAAGIVLNPRVELSASI